VAGHGGERWRRDRTRRRKAAVQVRKGKELTCGARMLAVEEREGDSTKMRNSNEKVYFKGYVMGVRANWGGEGGGGLRRESGPAR
jgi:hypothetical protein